MSAFEQEIEINATPAALFDLTQDYDRRLLWDPFLKEARLVGNARTAAVGERAWCVARNGLGMETEYVSFNRPHQTAVKLTKGPWIIARFAGSWRFKEIAPGRTRVIFRYNIEARPRWLGPVFDPILRMIFTHELGKRLKGLKHASEHTDILKQPQALAELGA